ncbi:fumarylacetoacetate hydrolase family protein [Dictyobacter kobayashii]|uniref:Fumarylacetoacetate (FAA) hydrolase n=1 Tax=Dictyobacter kobayashii TaxID=2014872 RepID=A0A402AL58_9CHLR|nr:fumarylacetoacetate hydrolase family protein [Dictyobacter kobayashii]GCE19938.1 fumarylacetoacetate (FAA) hydrolase [Dictyobacter kobayashii]
MQLVRYRSTTGTIVLGLMANNRLVGTFPAPNTTLSDLLRLHIDELRMLIEYALQGNKEIALEKVLAPIDGSTEVWAAGVTYKRSEEARREESDTPNIYARVYQAERPELFFKATARRVSGPGELIAVRSDSHWDVPEPELAVVANAHGEIVGYTIANDVSSRSIEGENPLYLPQAKVYSGSCALGPTITLAWTMPDPRQLKIQMQIERGGKTYWEGETNTNGLKRSMEELISYLYRDNDFPGGAILCTGTALVPEHPFTLEQDDVVHIDIEQLGILHNPVVRGKAALLHRL